MTESPAPRRSPLKLGAQLVALAAVLGLLGLLIWKVVHQEHSKIPQQVAKGERPEAPAFSLPRLDGAGTLSLASFKGKAVVLNFWASWCPPCRDEAPVLERAWQQNRDRGIVVLGVDGSDDFTGDAKAFMRKHGMTYPAVRDQRFKMSTAYGLTGLPETFFINRRGKVVGHVAGPVSHADVAEGIERAMA